MVAAISRVLLGLSLLFSVMSAVGMRFLNEDLYVALVAGRDILGGRLGQPDSWAFTTGGEVWMDPGWLSNLFFYLSYLWLEDFGPVLIQVVLLLSCIALMYLRCRRLGASPEASLLALTLGVLSMAPFLQIRDANFGLFYFVLLTTLVAARPSDRWWRYVGVLAVMVLWCNSHGTYVMGFGILGLKIVISWCSALGPFQSLWASVLRRGLEQSAGMGKEGRACPEVEISSGGRIAATEALLWTATFAVSLAAAAFLNPYGPAYLLVPYIQLSARTVTQMSADWLPLLHWKSLATTSFFHPTDVRPFVATAFATLIVGIAALVRAARRRALPGLLSQLVRTSKAELSLEIIVPLVLIVLSFRFRRTIFFAGMSMIPLIALSLRCWLPASTGAGRTRFPGGSEGGRRLVYLACGIGLLLFTALTFFRTTVPPYLPGNPTQPDRSLAAQLMSFGEHPWRVARFINRNHIAERIFAGWVISGYLLLKDPGIEVFMDCRDQSAYPDQVLRDYFSILRTNGTDPKSVRRALDLLKTYKVEAVVLHGNPIEFNLGIILMGTQKWACLYYDLETLLLVRSDSDNFGSYVREGRLPPLRYPDEKSRMLSRAVLEYFMTGKIPDKLTTYLKRSTRETPHPNIYGLIYLSGRSTGGCMKQATKEYFFSEGKRLASMDPLTPQKGRDILLSLIRILSLLDQDERACLPIKGPVPYRQLINNVKQRLKQLEKVYLGYRAP